jgi:methylated-DNA-protein-cysteine methyltransferase-like protein
MQENFYMRVFEITRKISVGKVTSYGAIAKYLGAGQSARMVGWALNKSELHKNPVPAHRVVNRNGLLTGKNHFANRNTMIELLESEGIKVEDNRIVNFQKVFWQPK